MHETKELIVLQTPGNQRVDVASSERATFYKLLHQRAAQPFNFAVYCSTKLIEITIAEHLDTITSTTQIGYAPSTRTRTMGRLGAQPREDGPNQY
jgi:hypothetical protein